MLNKNGEVADFLDVDQFEPGKSAYECVAYSAALCKYAGKPGSGPSGTGAQVSSLAQNWYAREEGSNSASNANGMSLPAEYDMLTGIGLHYHELSPTVSAVKQALTQGYPVLVCGAETGFYDMDLGDTIPYSWTPSGNHCIVASGIAPDGNLLVHDCASIAPSGVRSGPRRYDASKMRLVSATMVALSWQGDFSVFNIPTGWHDNGTILTAPNGITVRHGFRAHILASTWNAANVPQEAEQSVSPVLLHNTALGAGNRQCFRDGIFWWTSTKGVIWEPYLGLELKACYDLLAKQQAPAAPVTPVVPPAPVTPVAPPANVAAAIKDLQDLQSAVTKVLAELGH